MKPSVTLDLKTERTNVGQPLPPALRILPVAFFLSILGAIGISAYSFWQIGIAEKKTALAIENKSTEEAEKKKLEAEEVEINKEVKNAEEVRDWLAGTNQLQPLVTTIARSMTPESTISQITLARREEMSAHIAMALEVNSASGQQQLDMVRTSVAGALGYNSYADNVQTKDKTHGITFDCIWIKNENSDSPTK